MEGERDIQQGRWRERSKQGKDEIIVEMSEMCLRALQFLRVSLNSQFVRPETLGHLLPFTRHRNCQSGSPATARSCIAFRGGYRGIEILFYRSAMFSYTTQRHVRDNSIPIYARFQHNLTGLHTATDLRRRRSNYAARTYQPRPHRRWKTHTHIMESFPLIHTHPNNYITPH